MAKAIVRKPAASVKPTPAGLLPQKPYPPLTLISKATAKYPLADTDPRKQLDIIARRLREVVQQGENLSQLTDLDDQNPIIIGTTYFLDVLMERVSEIADSVDDVTAMLQPTGKGGAR
jgi:hypothetical protein